MTRPFAVWCLLGLIGWAGAATAETTRYVTDRMEITLRSGKTNEHRIIKMLPSGTAVQVLEEDEASGYARVRIGNDLEGWVLSRYLLAQPVARDQLAKAEQTVAQLRNELDNAKQQLATLSGSHQNLSQEQQSLSSQNKKLQEDLNRIRQTAANALTLDSENETLKKRVFALERDVQVLQQQNESLKDRSQRDWFVAGAGVIFIGMLMGLAIPKIRWRKKSSWESL